MATRQKASTYHLSETGNTAIFEGWLQRTLSGRIDVRFRCDACRKEHHHGSVEAEGATEAWRESHCWNERSPLYHKSLVIKIDPDAEPRPALAY